MEDRYMKELHEDMEREKKFQDVRQGLMGFILGGGLVGLIASPDWKSMVVVASVAVVSEFILWLEK